MDPPERSAAPPHDSPFRSYDDWFQDPWATPEVRAERRREKHRRWIAGISDRDWQRLADRADAVMAGGAFAKFEDLDAPIAIGVYRESERHKPNGTPFGRLRGCVLMAWPKRTGRRNP